MKEKGINERKIKKEKLIRTYQLDFHFPLFQGEDRSGRFKNNVNFDNLNDIQSIFNCIHNYITDDIKNVFYHIVILLNYTRKKYLTAKDNFKKTDQGKTPLIMFWLPKMHKTPIGERFIITLKNCSTKPLSDMISKVFNVIF